MPNIEVHLNNRHDRSHPHTLCSQWSAGLRTGLLIVVHIYYIRLVGPKLQRMQSNPRIVLDALQSVLYGSSLRQVSLV